jgi:hypothetical protein
VILEEMLNKIHEIDAKLATQYPSADLAAKGGFGFGASFATMTINDWAGLLVAVLTSIYMTIQIVLAWKRMQKESKNERIQD